METALPAAQIAVSHPWWMWASFISFVLVLLAIDLGLHKKNSHSIPVSEALWRSLGFFVLAMGFGAGIWHYMGAAKGTEFITGYLIELSLSVDNIFVFVLIFTHFMVPPKYQHRVLFWGILGALILRGVMIGLGAALIARFDWILYIFGAFLIISGVKMLFAANAEPDMENNSVVNFMRKRFRVTQDFVGQKFFVKQKGLLYMTPLFVVLVLIEISDLVFAVDSIPAIFAITHDPFIVFTSNVFAILGLRSLYFALAAIVHRFHYLKYGLSLVLMVIGTKMLLNSWYKAHVIDTTTALGITALLIFGSMALSLFKTRGDKVAAISTGWVPGSTEKPAKAKGRRKAAPKAKGKAKAKPAAKKKAAPAKKAPARKKKR